MKRLILPVLLVAGLAAAADVDSMCVRAQWLLFNRHLAPDNLRAAYDLMQQARALAPNHEQTLYLWSRIHFQYGDDATTGRDKIRWYERAKAICETLKTVNDANALGHLWWANAYGRIGQVRGVMRSLFMVPTLKKEFGRALQLAPDNPTCYDALGVLYYELPGIAGGSLSKSEDHLIRGLTLDPNYTVLRLDLAKTYIKAGRRDDARAQLRLVLATSCPTIPADFALDDRPEAEELLRQIGER
jgi:tetratricopeptide (TPR) repeat protein